MPSAPTRMLTVERMGRVPYAPMLALQQQRWAEVEAGNALDTLFLLEHEPVVTLGKNSGAGHVRVSEAELGRRGVALFQTGRGGDVTYHGPGQLVGYPILHLQQPERDIKRYVWRLEEVLIRVAADFGVCAERVEGLRGIWVGNNKVGAIGVRIARWTTLHGFALNVRKDLGNFGLIVPCGLHGKGVTSIGTLMGTDPPMALVQQRCIEHAAAVLERVATQAPPTSLPDRQAEASA